MGVVCVCVCAFTSFVHFHLWLCHALVDLPGAYSAVAGSLSAIGRELLLRWVLIWCTGFIRKLLPETPPVCLSIIACPE